MNINRKCFIFSVIIFLFIGISQPILAQKIKTTQTGPASWYGSKYHGRKTSSGERYNKNDMTAAHKTLPFGTKVKVTNLANNETVVLRINDRGPFVGNRIIDVSEVAAQKLNIHSRGVAKVKVEVIELPDNGVALNNSTGTGEFSIQLGSFTKAEYALEHSNKLKAIDKSIQVELMEGKLKDITVHQIKVGRFNNKQEAEAFNDLLKEEGLEGIVRES
jgi:rare lipoprotein A